MPRFRSDPVSADDLSRYLETSDFQLGLDVFNSFVTRGVRPTHGGLYTDPITSKDRQYDLRAEIQHGICTLKLAVECKNLKPSLPLLVSRVPRMIGESYHEVVLGRTQSLPRNSGDIFRAQGQIFRSREPVGKAATQVGRTVEEGKDRTSQILSNDSEAYEKWSQAIASSNDLIGQCGHSSIADATVAAAVVFPVLVVPNETLWCADYSVDGVLERPPQQVAQCTLFVGKRAVAGAIEYTISHLLIFTKAAFDTYLELLKDSHSDEWENLFPTNRTLVAYERGENWRQGTIR